MKKLYRIVIVGLVVLLLVGLAWFAVQKDEPTYQNRRISLIMDDRAARKPGIPFYDALSKIGTNAIPYAVRDLARNDSAWRKQYGDIWPKSPKFLQKILPQPKPSLKVVDGANVFFFVGPASIPHGIALLKHESTTVRQAAALGLGSVRRKSIEGNQAVPALVESLADSDQLVRLYAEMSLREMGADASNAVPALTKIVADVAADIGVGPRTNSTLYLRAGSAIALGKIGPVAKSAIPSLKMALKSPDPYLRVMAAVAIWRIDADVETALPVLLRDMPLHDEHEKWDGIIALGEMGSRAQSAIPLLATELKECREVWMLDFITNALVKIDPEAAAKLGVFPKSK